VFERVQQQMQAQGYPHVPLGALVFALLIGVVMPSLGGYLHELAHAVVARHRGLVGVELPRLDLGRRFSARNGLGLTRVAGARDPRGWVGLHPAVDPRAAVAIVAAGPAADAALAFVLAAAGLAAAGTIGAVLLWTALDAAMGAAACLLRRDGGFSDGAVLRRRLAR
jgi:hypothetical protein